MKQHIAEFTADLQLIGRQPLTIEAHVQEMARLHIWLQSRDLDWQQLSRKQLQQYARTKAHLAPSTRANNFTTWRVFFAWAVENEYIPSSPAVGFKTPMKPKPVPKALSRPQIRTLIDHLVQLHAGRLRDQRDRILILTGLYAGLRANELAGLHWPAVDLDERVITIRLSKMNHGRSVPIHPQLANELAIWKITQCLSNPTGPVFSLDGIEIAAGRITKIGRRAALATGLPLTTHVLRHTFATWALRRGGNLFAVSKALGHKDLKQTEIYLSATIDDLRPIVDSLPDIGQW